MLNQYKNERERSSVEERRVFRRAVAGSIPAVPILTLWSVGYTYRLHSITIIKYIIWYVEAQPR